MNKKLLFLVLPLMFNSQAQMFSNDECALVVASRQTTAEVRDYVNTNISGRRYLKIFKAPNGWYAITIGMLKPEERESVISKWKESGKIPQGSYCSKGKTYLHEVGLDGKIITQRNKKTVADHNIFVQENGGRPIALVKYNSTTDHTRLTFKAQEKMSVCFNRSGKNKPFLLYNNSEKKYMSSSNGVDYCPSKTTLDAGYTFTVDFPKASSFNTKSFSFIEGDCGSINKKGCWRFRNISLSNDTQQTNDTSAATVSKQDLYYAEINEFTRDDLRKYSKAQLRLLRNYFFAKEGYKFKPDSDLKTFFEKYSWYKPTSDDASYIYENLLNNQDKKNIALIKEVEKYKSSEQEQRAVSQVNTGLVKDSVVPNTAVKIDKQLEENLTAKQDKNGKWGFAHKKQEWVNGSRQWYIKPQFDDADSFKNGLAKVLSGEKYGLINITGSIVIPASYDDIGSVNGNYIAVKIADKWGFINQRGQMVIPPLFDYARSFKKGASATAIGQNKKYGFIDKQGNIIIKPQYDEAWGNVTQYGLAVIKQGDKFGIVNTKNEVVVPIIYDFILQIYGEFYSVYKKGDYNDGIVSKEGKWIVKPGTFKVDMRDVEKNDKYGTVALDGTFVKPIYDEKIFFHNGLGVVEKDGKYGFISEQTGEVVIPLIYKVAWNFSNNGLTLVRKKGDYLRFINKQGEKVALDMSFDWDSIADGFDKYSDLGRFKKDDKYGFYNSKGHLVIPAQFDDTGDFSNDGRIIEVKKNGKWGHVDIDNNVVTPFKYDGVSSFYGSNIAEVKIGDKYGAVNRQGELVIPAEYDKLAVKSRKFIVKVTKDEKEYYIDNNGNYLYDEKENINNVLVAIKKNRKWGFLGRSSKKQIIGFELDKIGKPIKDKVVLIKKDGLWGAIDNKGKQIFDYQFDAISEKLSFGLLRVEKNDKYGFINLDGIKIVPTEYEYIGEEFYDDGRATAEKNSKWGVIDSTGKIVVDFKYDSSRKNLNAPKTYSFVSIKDKKGLLIKGEEVLPAIYDEVEYISADNIIQAKKGNSYIQFNSQGKKITGLDKLKLFAQDGDVDKQMKLGYMYLNGTDDVEMSPQEAVKWFGMAAKQVNSDAQIKMGFFYADGVGGLEKNSKTAYAWFKEAGKNGKNIDKYLKKIKTRMTDTEIKDAEKIKLFD